MTHEKKVQTFIILYPEFHVFNTQQKHNNPVGYSLVLNRSHRATILKAQPGFVLYFAYYIFRSIDISTLSIQYIFLGILNFLSSRNNGFCKKYPIQKCVQLCPTVSIGTTYNKHVWQHIPPHKCGTCSNKTSIGKLTSDSPLLTIVDMERKKEGTPGV